MPTSRQSREMDTVQPLRNFLIESKYRAYRRAAVGYYLDLALRLSAAVSSLIAGIYAAQPQLPVPILSGSTQDPKAIAIKALIALAPAAILGWLEVYQPGRWSKWHWARFFDLISLQRRLDYQGASEAEISELLSRMEAQQLTTWLPFDKSGEIKHENLNNETISAHKTKLARERDPAHSRASDTGYVHGQESALHATMSGSSTKEERRD